MFWRPNSVPYIWYDSVHNQTLPSNAVQAALASFQGKMAIKKQVLVHSLVFHRPKRDELES
ncbi:hypothetical protein CANCADRAFT_30859 [Tortispora caseinolytica NRRL Y-17796]|uniref:Uncharacterized protein n=1 Tax=Tortispora caseinolytica NRRL Y-17796 TaxID=767744 RepID=A0A1E4TM32_9ASCO|nr:hypothetical protein CANCADRAFT_30859 [Tortispora caseinolytica NRRL Y-17796]